jgi:ligand-binding sensor domain-containing protein/signal transduction histidine kinase
MTGGRLRLLFVFCLLAGAGEAAGDLREPVHPRRNVDEFQPVVAKFIRFTIRATNSGEPGIDELEIYGPDDEPRNLALAANGARATASGTLPGFQIHELEGVNDGHYGNGHCWIADRREGAWVQIELPKPARVNKIIWGRDRESKFIDRLATSYIIEAALSPGQWQQVASSADRRPPPTTSANDLLSPAARQFVNRFAPVSTTLSQDAERGSSDYTVDSWQTPDGLPANTITAITQTPDGYLWLGTLNGLARFDGVRFKVFGKSDGLPNPRVLCLLLDRSGTLWIGTEGGGVARWQNGIFSNFRKEDGLANNVVQSLAEDKTGRIWMATAGGLSCWHEGKFIHDQRLVPSSATVYSRIVASGEQLWMTEFGGVNVLENGRLTRPSNRLEPSAFSSIYALHRGPSNRLWFGGANNYVGCLATNGEVKVFAEEAGQLLNSIWEVLESRSGDVWVGTASGGLRRLRDNHFISLTTQEGLSDNSIRCLFEDRESNLWVGTVGGGLNRIKPRRLNSFTTRDGLSHNVVMSLAEDPDGVLWIGSNCGGLNMRRDGQITAFTGDYLLDNECIWSLLAARDGSLWIGTWGGGLFLKKGNEIKRYPFTHTGNDEPILALYQDRNDGLWVGTYSQGLKLFRDGAFVDISGTNDSVKFITSMAEDPSGALWVGTGGNGLVKLDFGSSPSTVGGRSSLLFSREQGLPSDFVRTLMVDKKGVLWIGTDGGLARFSNGRVAAFTRAHGLPDEVISQILEDDRGYLWLGSNKGIFRVSEAELESIANGGSTPLSVLAYGRADGMENAQCTGGFNPAGLRTRDGRLWFSTVKGLVQIDPNGLVRNELPPQVLIEEVRVDGNPVTGPEKLLQIPPSATRLDLQFTATSLTAPERNRFRHRLEGLDKDWVEDGPQRVAAYHHLPPGRYQFQLAASNGDGVWNQAGIRLNLRVLPPFWKTWWFGVLTGSVVLGGGGWSVRSWSVRRLGRKLRALQEQHALEKERTRIAQDIHDELGASLTRIALLTELGQKHKDRAEDVAADLNKISATAREAVRAMDAIVWAVNPRNDTLDSFANYVSQYAEDLFRLTAIRYRLDVPPDLPDRPLSTEVRHHLFLAVKETLNNVVRHSGATEVWLRLSCAENELALVVADNGKGLQQSRSAPGQDGLLNLKNRLQSLGGVCQVQSEEGKGTEVRLILPLND